MRKISVHDYNKIPFREPQTINICRSYYAKFERIDYLPNPSFFALDLITYRINIKKRTILLGPYKSLSFFATEIVPSGLLSSIIMISYSYELYKFKYEETNT